MLSRPLSRPLLTLAVALSLAAASGCGGVQARKARHLEKGQTYLAAENYDKARVEFQNARQIDPKDPEALYELGVIAERIGNPRQAAQFYQGAVEVGPDHIPARAGLARLYLFAGVPERTLELLKPALDKHPDDARLLTLRAAVRNQQKDVSAALADATRAVELAPTDEDAVATLAGIYRSQRELAKAQALLEQSVKSIPGTVNLRVALADIDAQSGHLAEAEAQLLKVVELKPAERVQRERLAQFYVQSNQIDAAERTVRQAIKDLPAEHSLKLALIDFLAAQRGRPIAEAELKTMIAAAPDESALQFGLARFYIGGKDLKQAETVYQGIIDRWKFEAAGLAARDQLAAARFQSGDSRGALALANEVLDKSPRDEDALVLRGNIALANHDPSAAIADLRAVLRDQPGAVRVLRALARAEFVNGEPESAEATMRRAFEANPTDQVLQLDLARLLADLGKPEQSQAMILNLASQRPNDPELLDLEFRVSLKMQDYVTAKAAADAIVALQPKLAVGHFYQGMLAEAHGRTDEALRLYRAASALQPDSAEPLEAEVRLLVSEKRMPEALKRLDEIGASQPENAAVLFLKGNVLAGNGRPVESQEAFKQAIARSPKWWLPYRGLANAQLAAKQDPAVAVATLRIAKTVVDDKDALGQELASLLERLGKPDEAIAEYEEVVRAYPNSESAANNLAMLLATYRTDRPSLDRAKELSARFADSANPYFMDTYGWVMYKRGESATSVPVLARVVKRLPGQVVVRYHLGMAEALAGKNTEARENLTQVVNSGQQFAGLADAKATLDRIAKLPDAAAPAPKS
jgi:tetratricopeptide (TPR) repeat protein